LNIFFAQDATTAGACENLFPERSAGAILTDPATAIMEPVANCWDAYATEVLIVWPDAGSGRPTPMFTYFRQVASSSIERCQKPYSRERGLARRGGGDGEEHRSLF
jgi:hypothetical protein